MSELDDLRARIAGLEARLNELEVRKLDAASGQSPVGDGTGGYYWNLDPANGGPALVIVDTDGTVRAVLGNVDNQMGLPDALAWGIALGDYAGGNYLTYEPTGGFQLHAGGGNVALDSTGLHLVAGGGAANSIIWKDADGNRKAQVLVNAAGVFGILLSAGASALISGPLTLGDKLNYDPNDVTLANGTNVDVPFIGVYNRINGPTGGFSLHGIVAGSDGDVKWIENPTGQAMTIKNSSNTETTAGNRILTGTGADLTNVTGASLIYDGDASRWFVMSYK